MYTWLICTNLVIEPFFLRKKRDIVIENKFTELFLKPKPVKTHVIRILNLSFFTIVRNNTALYFTNGYEYSLVNPLAAKLFNWNFHSLKVVSR